MDNLIRRTTDLAMYMVRAYVKPGDTVIDATCGNGQDTLALAKLEPGKLYAFDVQPGAVSNTRKFLEENGYGRSLLDGRFTVEQLPHEELARYFSTSCMQTQVKAIVFNLGYLPGGDKTLTTKTCSTLTAVRAAMDLLSKDGLICITMYSGHPEGREEKQALLAFAQNLDSRLWHTAYISMPNQENDPPEILLITRK